MKGSVTCSPLSTLRAIAKGEMWRSKEREDTVAGQNPKIHSKRLVVITKDWRSDTTLLSACTQWSDTTIIEHHIEESTVREDCEMVADQIGLADDLNWEGCLFGWA